MFDLIEKWDNIAFYIYNIYGWLRFWLIDRFRYRKQLKRNAVLKGRHKGEQCFIVLNGPSIKEYDLSSLKGENVICSNFFELTGLYDIVKPNYHCVIDSDAFRGTRIPKIQKSIYGHPETTFILNKQALGIIDEKKNPNIFYAIGNNFPTATKVRTDFTCEVSIPVNAAIFCIQVAIYLGFKDVYVLGWDFQPGPLMHAYKVMPEERYGIDVYKKQSKSELCAMHWYYYLAQLQSFYVAKEAKKKQINIYNLNGDSAIRAFDIKRFEQVMK